MSEDRTNGKVITVDFDKGVRAGPTPEPVHGLASRSTEEAFHDLLDSGMVLMLLETEGCDLPPNLMREVLVQLSWSHQFHLKDLEVGSAGVSGTLDFDSAPFHVRVPWEAVRRLTSPGEKVQEHCVGGHVAFATRRRRGGFAVRAEDGAVQYFKGLPLE